jgi:hypothetical protein
MRKDFMKHNRNFENSQELKGQSHEKVGEMSVWGISLGPN